MISDKFSQRLISVLPDKCPQSQIPSFPKNKKIKNRNPVIPAQAGIQTGRHGNLSDKTVSLDFTF
ncbi:pilin [Neisseria meningitidis]|nr:pilin [Neisseria meningitidis]RPC80873.1 pilin [Neisseria meningitidis]RPD03487.1 pilin [Neisseria meningitidis]RPD11570.1 pilin [Neisseria meningitidis]RPD12689.1 pilin [Neisseria meningitidis]